jgi:hypothetical protein
VWPPLSAIRSLRGCPESIIANSIHRVTKKEKAPEDFGGYG